MCGACLCNLEDMSQTYIVSCLLGAIRGHVSQRHMQLRYHIDLGGSICAFRVLTWWGHGNRSFLWQTQNLHPIGHPNKWFDFILCWGVLEGYPNPTPLFFFWTVGLYNITTKASMLGPLDKFCKIPMSNPSYFLVLEDNEGKCTPSLIPVMSRWFCWKMSWFGQKQLLWLLYRWGTSGIWLGVCFSLLFPNPDAEVGLDIMFSAFIR